MGLRVGDTGVADSVLSPSGIVRIGDRRYQARSAMQWIEAGHPVIVLKGGNQGLLVQCPGDDFEPSTLDRFGEPVTVSFGEAVQTAAAVRAERFENWQVARKAYLRRSGVILGGLFAVAAVVIGWSQLSSYGSPVTRGVFVTLAVLTGAGLGWWLLEIVEHMLCSVEQSLHRVSVPATCLALSGLLVGASWGFARHGLEGALACGLAATLALGLPLPAIALVLSADTDEGEGAIGGGEV